MLKPNVKYKTCFVSYVFSNLNEADTESINGCSLISTFNHKYAGKKYKHHFDAQKS